MSQQLHEAHKLIEQGKFAEARQLLQTLDDPTARQWLAQLNAAKRPRKQSLSLSLPLLIALAIVIGVAALILILLFTPTILARMQNRPAAETQAALDMTLNANLNHFCTMTLGYGGEEPCMSWAENLIHNYHTVAATCIAATGVETEEARAQVADCFRQSNVPLPS